MVRRKPSKEKSECGPAPMARLPDKGPHSQTAHIPSTPREIRREDIAERKRQFLEAFMDCGRVDLATKRVGILYHFPYQWARADGEFEKAWAEARQVAAQRLEDAAFRRSVNGVLKPVYQRGSLVGMVREYSDSLTMFLLKGLKPEVYRERVSMSGEKDGEPIKHDVQHHGLSDEAAEIVRKKILGLGGSK